MFNFTQLYSLFFFLFAFMLSCELVQMNFISLWVCIFNIVLFNLITKRLTFGNMMSWYFNLHSKSSYNVGEPTVCKCDGSTHLSQSFGFCGMSMIMVNKVFLKVKFGILFLFHSFILLKVSIDIDTNVQIVLC